MKVVFAITWFVVTMSQCVCGDVVQTDANAPHDLKINHMIVEVQDLLNLKVPLYQVLLRDLSRIVECRCVSQPLNTISQELEHQGCRIIYVWENEDIIRTHYLVRTNALLTPSGYSMDLQIILLSDKLKGGKESGQVFSAKAALIRNINLPFSDFVAQSQFSKGSVLDRMLQFQEVRDAGAKWPFVRQIYVFYGFLFNQSIDYSPSGFTVTMEFCADTNKDIGRQRFVYAFDSGLDPYKTQDGLPFKGAFTSKDVLGDVMKLENSEEWFGDVHNIEENKAKYLRGHH